MSQMPLTPLTTASWLVDEDTLHSSSVDFGGYVRRRPRAVARPESIEQVVEVVEYARRHRIPLAVRGQGHTNHGQSLVTNGIVLDMTAMRRVHALSDGRADAEAGLLWSDLIEATFPLGLTPPVLTDFLGLTIGGTLSVGGFGTQTFRYGNQTDNVLELTVVTGTGEVVTCSRERNADLFDAIRGGLGQFGVIVRASLPLLRVPSRLCLTTVPYRDAEAFIAEMDRLVASGQCQQLTGSGGHDESGRFAFVLEVVRYLPDEGGELEVLSNFPGAEGAPQTAEMTYVAYARRYDATFAEMQSSNAWRAPHPWLDLMLPATKAPRLVAEAAARLKPADLGTGNFLIYPGTRAASATPLVRVPDDDRFFLFDILRGLPGADEARIAGALEDNRRLYTEFLEQGCGLYPISSVNMTPADWRRHFGDRWPAVLAAKQRFDPDRVLGSSYDMFE